MFFFRDLDRVNRSKCFKAQERIGCMRVDVTWDTMEHTSDRDDMDAQPSGLRSLLRASSRRDFREPSPLSEVVCPSFRLHKPSRLEAFDNRNVRDMGSAVPGSRSSSRYGRRGTSAGKDVVDTPSQSNVEFDESTTLVKMILHKRIKTLPSREQRLLRYKHLPEVYELLLAFEEKEWRNLSKRVVNYAVKLVECRRKKNDRKKLVLDRKNVFSSKSNDVRLEASFRCELFRLLKYDDLEKVVLCAMVEERKPAKQPESLADSLKSVSSKQVNKSNIPENGVKSEVAALKESKEFEGFDEEKEELSVDLGSASSNADIQNIVRDVEKHGVEAEKEEAKSKQKEVQSSVPAVGRKTKRAQRRTIFKLQGVSGTPQLMTDIQRLFGDLRMPIKRRLAFLIKYSSEGKWRDLAAAVHDWSHATKWIVTIEHIVGVMVTAENERVNPANALRDSQVKLLESANCYISMAKMFGVSTQVWLYAILERAFPQCQNLLLSIRRKWDDVVTFQGHDYLEDRVTPFLDFNLQRKRCSDRYAFKLLDHKDAADTSFDITRVRSKTK